MALNSAAPVVNSVGCSSLSHGKRVAPNPPHRGGSMSTATRQTSGIHASAFCALYASCSLLIEALAEMLCYNELSIVEGGSDALLKPCSFVVEGSAIKYIIFTINDCTRAAKFDECNLFRACRRQHHGFLRRNTTSATIRRVGFCPREWVVQVVEAFNAHRHCFVKRHTEDMISRALALANTLIHATLESHVGTLVHLEHPGISSMIKRLYAVYGIRLQQYDCAERPCSRSKPCLTLGCNKCAKTHHARRSEVSKGFLFPPYVFPEPPFFVARHWGADTVVCPNC